MIHHLVSIFKDSPNSFEGQKEGEKVLLLLRKHPFIILIRLGFLFLAGLIPVVLALTLWSHMSEHDLVNVFLFVSSLWYLLLWLLIFHSLALYTLNTVTITDHRVIDSDQHGFFDRKISELHSHRIQDVTTHTNGIIQTFLKFGDVVVQTAASEKQFVFHQVPKPDHVKDVLMHITASKHSGVISSVHN